jgi:CHAT domain-containing protein
VSDAATAALLLDFHKRYAASGNAADALRQAQIHAVKSQQPIQNWAAFIYTGN